MHFHEKSQEEIDMRSIQQITSDGTLQVVDLSINYLDRSEISVYVNYQMYSAWSWANDVEDRIVFDSPIPAGYEVVIKRTTDISQLKHYFSKGAAFTAEALDEDLQQVLHIAQEGIEVNVAKDFYNEINMHGHRIKNVGPAIDDGDAISLSQYKNDMQSAWRAKELAWQAEGEAKTSANAAAEYANMASNSASLAANYAIESANGATQSMTSSASAVSAAEIAQEKADIATSAAASAESSKIAAANSAANAAQSAIEAEEYANSAASSATSAASSAQAAQTAANAVSATANVSQWEYGGNYSVGIVVYSPIDLQNYRCKIPGVSTIDPSLDQNMWEPVGTTPQYTDHFTNAYQFIATNVNMLNKMVENLRVGPWTQAGKVTIYNKGIISGCTATKSTDVQRSLNISGGQYFADGTIGYVNSKSAAVVVPDNTAGFAQIAYVYLKKDGNSYNFEITALGENPPENGILLQRISVPANNTSANDPYLASVSITDVRRVEGSYPVLMNNPPEKSIMFNRRLSDTDYRVHLDISSASGPLDTNAVVVSSRAVNGMTVGITSSMDNVTINWVVERLHD
jgi:hypothetical protein